MAHMLWPSFVVATSKSENSAYAFKSVNFSGDTFWCERDDAYMFLLQKYLSTFWATTVANAIVVEPDW